MEKGSLNIPGTLKLFNVCVQESIDFHIMKLIPPAEEMLSVDSKHKIY